MKLSHRNLAGLAGLAVAAALALGSFPGAARADGPWYVAPGGSDTNDCLSPSTPCGTLNGVLGKATDGDTVYAAIGTYQDLTTNVVAGIGRAVTLSGGWDNSFASRTGRSTIDGAGVQSGLTASTSSGVILIEHFVVQNSANTAAVVVSTNSFDPSVTVTLNDLVISSNPGRGIWNSGTLVVNDSIISNNTNSVSGSFGGGIYNHDYGNLTLNRTAVLSNTATTGAGIHNNTNGVITITQSLIRGNIAGCQGGGLYSFGTTTLNSSALNSNVSTSCSGAGAYNAGGILHLNNTTVINNTATNGSGGGIVSTYLGTLTVNNSTIAGNEAKVAAGGLAAGTATTMTNSILALNINPYSPNCTSGDVTSAGYNLVGSTLDCTFLSTSTDLVNAEPQLILLPSALEFAPLLVDSPAVNGGNPTGCLDNSGQPLTTDQRGVARAGRCDIGAYERTDTSGPIASLLALSGTPQTGAIFSTFADPFQALALDSVGNLFSDAAVTFTAPASGPGGSFLPQHSLTTTQTTDENGIAIAAPFEANALTGSYAVTATVSGVVTPTRFDLTNRLVEARLPLMLSNYCGGDFDDFSSPSSGWAAGEDDFARYGYLNGEYQVLSKQGGYYFFFRAPNCRRQNYVVETDAHWAGTPGASYGLLFGITGAFDQLYLFDINTDFQLYELLRLDASGLHTIVPVTGSPAILAGGATNHLKVTRNGTQIDLEINGVVVSTVHDGTITGLTDTGLVSSSYSDLPVSDARFDNFRISVLTDTSAPAPAQPGLSAPASAASTHRLAWPGIRARWAAPAGAARPR